MTTKRRSSTNSTGNNRRTIGRRPALGIGLVVALATLALASIAHAAAVSGTVDTIDLAKSKVTIKQGNGTSLTLGVKGFTRITRNSATTTLSGLALRDAISAQYLGATALKLTATGPAVTSTSGPVAAVSTGTGALTIGSTIFFTNANTKISRNGQVVSLGKLTLHDTAVVHSASSGVDSQGGDDADDVVASGPEEGEVKGTVSAVVGSQVTITPDGGGTPVTVTADSTTIVEVGGEPATVADLQVGQTAEAEYDPATLIAFSIEVDIPDPEDEGEIEGTVAAVDVSAGTLTITPNGGGADVVLTVTAATDVEVNGDNATLADVQVGMPVRAEYDAATLLATEVKAGTD